MVKWCPSIRLSLLLLIYWNWLIIDILLYSSPYSALSDESRYVLPCVTSRNVLYRITVCARVVVGTRLTVEARVLREDLRLTAVTRIVRHLGYGFDRWSRAGKAKRGSS